MNNYSVSSILTHLYAREKKSDAVKKMFEIRAFVSIIASEYAHECIA